MQTKNACSHTIIPIILCAGHSKRMNTCKQTLPWGSTTIIGHINDTLSSMFPTQSLVIVAGEHFDSIQASLRSTSVQMIRNDDPDQGGMTRSLALGLQAAPAAAKAAMVVLGDQPMITKGLIAALVEVYCQTSPEILIPSYNKRRGHPWIVARHFWEEINSLGENGGTLREFLNHHQDSIKYYITDDPAVIQDIDTPDDYKRTISQIG